MGRLLDDTVVIDASPDAIWRILEDPDALARVLPGCERLAADGPGRFEGQLASKIGFMTVRADVVARLMDIDRDRHCRLELQGRPRGMAGSFRVDIPFDIEPIADAVSRVSYSVDLQVTGRLASFGAPLLRSTIRAQIAQLVQNIDRETRTGPPAH